MKIKVIQTFLDGVNRFEKEDIRTVSDEVGARYVANGWAEDVAGRVATDSASAGTSDLAINNSVIGTGDSNG